MRAARPRGRGAKRVYPQQGPRPHNKGRLVQALVFQKKSFRGGVHPLHGMHEGKGATAGKPVREFISDSVVIPMAMHIGAPSKPLVKKGDRVLVGQVIGEPVGGLGLPVHASVSGTVTEVGIRQQLGAKAVMCVAIENDFMDEKVEWTGMGNVENCPAEAIIPAIRNAGICGMGGASFPTHIKLSPPPEKNCDTIIVNGAECETFLTADHRLMLETPIRVVDGLRAAMRAMGVKKGIIAIEDNKPDAIAAMQAAAQGREGVEVAVLRTKYPQGGEKQLIEATTKRQVPSGGLPADAGVIVINAGTAAAIADAVIDGKPLIDRILTVTGKVREPANLKVRIGTIFMDIIGACGGYSEDPGKIVSGGTMTGICAPNENVSAVKSTSGIVVLNNKESDLPDESPCLRCGRCVDTCPIGLNPYRLKDLCESHKFEQARQEHLMDCILCGSCSYTCPARRMLTANFKIGKEMIQLAARRDAK
ncbi:MAG: electron transport complex subunit RsxC [Eubacteriales bacterium]|nr:electron transport complex subunit RsxC [Eubacteriales bacterium]